MMAWLQRRPLVAALAALAAVLIVMIGVESGLGTRIVPDITQQPVKSAAAPDARLLPSLVAVAPEQAYPETSARPLFVPTRRPAPPEPAGAKQAFSRGQFVLQGVIAVGENRTAMLREKSSGRIHRVERGKEINGITIEKIGATEVTLAMNGERETLAMTVQKAAGPGGATAGAAPAAAPQQGPFTAEAPATPGSPASPVARGASPDPAAAARPRGSAYAPATGTPGRPNAPQATTQPMTPEELLARRRARRNQPTQ